MKIPDAPVSRRGFLKGAAMLAAISVVALRAPLAEAGVPKAAMQYQDHPNGNKQCSKCIQFVPGKTSTADGTCKIVDGTISPHGYCLAFSAKA